MKNSMCIKIIREFRNPLNNRMAKVGEIFNVPKALFWFRRLEQKDCEKTNRAKIKKIRQENAGVQSEAKGMSEKQALVKDSKNSKKKG